MRKNLCSAVLVLAALSTAASPSRGEDASGLRLGPELKGGLLLHDIAHDNRASNSVDLNLEFLTSPLPLAHVDSKLLQALVSPRATIGASINTEGDTHQAYAGVTWTYPFDSGVFVSPFFGVAVHNGSLHKGTRPCTIGEIQAGCNLRKPVGQIYSQNDRPALGSRVLFREALEVGYRFLPNLSVSAIAAHMSNGGMFGTDNGGMSFVGLRVGYSFGG